MFMEWLRKAPTSVTITVVITCGLLALGVLGVYLTLSLQGADTTEFRQWVNTLGQILVFPLLGVTTVASLAAARASSRTEEQTNGELHQRDDNIAALRAQLRQRDSEIRALRSSPPGRR